MEGWHPPMSDHDAVSAFHDVVVTLDQTGESWPGDSIRVEGGKLSVAMSGPIPLPRRGATFTLTAVDNAGRTRVFRDLTLDASASRPPVLLVFG